MDRKLYGSGDQNVQTGILSSAGDPEFEVDSQNNDHNYRYDTDVREEQREGDTMLDLG